MNNDMDKMNNKAKRAFYNALRRGKTSVYNTHSDDVNGLMAEMNEFAEASECKESEHLTGYSEAQEELADILICCMTELCKRGVDVDIIVDAKLAFNETRK